MSALTEKVVVLQGFLVNVWQESGGPLESRECFLSFAMHDIQKFHISTPPYVSSDYHVAVPEPDKEWSIGPGF
jgi:hypothetical protein